MKFLLDTHVFLWFLSGDARLPAAWRDTIRQPHHEVYLSVVSLWETIIKHRRQEGMESGMHIDLVK